MFGDPTGKADARRRPRTGSGSGITVAAVVIGVALLASGCASGTPHSAAARRASTAPSAHRPVTKPRILTTTSSTAATTTTTAIKSTSTTAAAHLAPPPTTTTTAVPVPPGCNWADFSTSVTTDLPAYPTGQTVHITLTFRNDGPACSVDVSGYACPHVDIDNAEGQLTWTSDTVPSTGCAAVLTPGNFTVLAGTWSQSAQFDWTQVDCSTRSQGNSGTCAGPQVASGTYQIIGKDAQGSSQIPPSAPLGVTISS